jgi:hypothetical protein
MKYSFPFVILVTCTLNTFIFAKDDPSGYSVYGGAKANEIFQKFTTVMPASIANNIQAGQSFSELLTFCADLRALAAERSNTPNSKDFNTIRVPTNLPDSGGSLTPVLRYPLMRKALIENLLTLQKSETFTPLDHMFEYRWREHTVYEWLQKIPAEHNDQNQLGTFLNTIISGKRNDGSDEGSMWLFDYEKDCLNDKGTMIIQKSNRYSNALKLAYEFATSKENPVNIVDLKLSHVEFRLKGTNFTSRSFMFPIDVNSLPDYSDTPFALLHPPVSSVSAHLQLCEAFFDIARDCKDNDTEKLNAIIRFSHIFAITMPLLRGSASVNEWINRGLHLLYKLHAPYAATDIDVLAQASFTNESFLKKLSKTTTFIVPEGFTTEGLKIQENLYRQYFLKDKLGANIWEDFIGQPTGVTDVKRAEEVVISLTSYPERMPTTWLAIESLLRQEEKPDRVVLNLFEGEFPDKKLPWMIEQQLKRGLEINWNPINRKVFLKVIPTIQKFPEAVIVAVDDDIVYPIDRLKTLLDGYRAHPDCVIGQDVRVIPSVDGIVPPVMYWLLTGYSTPNNAIEPAYNLAPEGYQGILYPPHSVFPDYANEELYKSLCPTDDDIWMYKSVIANGKKIYKPENRCQKLEFIQSAQESSLTLGAINGQENNRLYNVYFDRLIKSGLLRNAGLIGLKSDLCEFLTHSVTQLPDQVHVSSLRHTEMFQVPISFDKGFSVLLKDGLLFRGTRATFRVCANKFPRNEIKLQLKGIPTITAQQPSIHYTIKRIGHERIISESDITLQNPFINLIDQADKDIVEYEIVTNAIPQDQFFKTYWVTEILFSPKSPDVDLKRYGGIIGDSLFQTVSAVMKSKTLPEMIKSNTPFSKIIEQAKLARFNVAKETNTEFYESFNMYRKEIKALLQNEPKQFRVHPSVMKMIEIGGVVDRCTKFPLMLELVQKKLSEIPQTTGWLPLSSEYDYRYRIKPIKYWHDIINSDNDDNTEYKEILLYLLTQYPGELSINNPDLAVKIHSSYQNVLLSQDTSDIKIGYFESRVKENDFFNHGFVFPITGSSESDFNNVPVLLVPPYFSVANQHWSLVEKAFNDARYATGDEKDIRNLIGEFHYKWGTAMPVFGGSSALGEWLSHALYVSHSLNVPKATIHAHFDQLIQGSFTLKEFLEKYMELF